jgi:hypothetical protein
MLTVKLSSPRLTMFALTFVMNAAFGIPMWAQDPPTVTAGYEHITGLPDDWTHHHAVFSNPGTAEEAIRNGTYDEWSKIVNDPRYVIQQLKRRSAVQGPSAEEAAFRTTQSIGTNEGSITTARLRATPLKPVKSPIKKDWNEALGTTTAPGNVVNPAKWSFSTGSASCASDFVIYPTGQAGSSSRASILAYYNLYTSGCSGTVPEVDWAYNTGGTVALSPVFSFNGNQVAFIQTSSSVASLVLLKYPLTPPGTGTITSPTTLTAVSASSYPGCNAPCMTTITLNGSRNDTGSNPYYDYLTDSLYVGDSGGYLHKFNPVFNGTPAEVTTSWPVQLKRGSTSDTSQPASPIYDIATGYVFVGTVSGYFYSVGTGNVSTTSGSIHGYSGQLDQTYGIKDAPLLDSTAGMAYVFAGNDTSGNDAVFQFPTTFTSGSGTEATLGSGGTGTTSYQFAGTFDNTYYTSSNGSSPTGYLYVCGTTAAAPVYQVLISGNSMSTVVTGPTVSSSSYYGRCSPVTEFFNPSVGSTTATGTLTITGTPATSWAGTTVTVGGTTYTFENSVSSTANQVLLYTSGSSSSTKQDRTAQNLYAAINANSGECYSSPCFGTGTTANASVTATLSGAVVTLTSKTSGAGGNFALSTTQSGITASGGQNGETGTDYIFLSVFAGTPSGCTNATSDGCVMSFNVTTPSSFTSSSTPTGALNLSAVTYASPTGGIIVDNGVSSPAGTSQIYFETQDTSGTSPCTGICAVQASQSAP